MIDRISLKRLNGQLEEIEYSDKLRNVFSFGLWLSRPNIDSRKIVLLLNQLQNIYQIVESARHKLLFSAKNIIKNYCQHFLKTDDIDVLEVIASDFLSSSVVYFNASFDYLRILIRIAYSSTEEMTNTISIDKLRKEILKKNIDDSDWWIVFCSLITQRNNNGVKEAKWINENSLISKEIKDAFHELLKINKALKNKYCANSLKHASFPYFKRTNIQNIIGANLQISLEQYYGMTKLNQISYGLPKKPLIIDDVQNFLIEYNNETVRTINLVQDDILELIDK